MDFTNGEFADNLQRANNLIAASETLLSASEGNEAISEDVLRAAVVFLHASMEELVRNLFIRRLPNTSRETLDKIPLLTPEVEKRPSKILLGSLLPYSGEFVENVIIKSIEAYTDTLNLNNSTQLAQNLEMAKIEVDGLQAHLPSLEGLMQRRHQIVHQMDRANPLDPQTDSLSSIDIQTVSDWRDTLVVFSQHVFSKYETSE